jgi:hypothetical protein
MGNTTKPPANILELPLGERAEMALKAAVEKVIEAHIRDGRPISIWRDGKVVEVSAQELRDTPANPQWFPAKSNFYAVLPRRQPFILFRLSIWTGWPGDEMQITKENKERFQTILGGTGSADPNEWKEFFNKWNQTTAFMDENPSVVADEALVNKPMKPS